MLFILDLMHIFRWCRLWILVIAGLKQPVLISALVLGWGKQSYKVPIFDRRKGDLL